jgi:hypothetical protein
MDGQLEQIMDIFRRIAELQKEPGFADSRGCPGKRQTGVGRGPRPGKAGPVAKREIMA